MEGEELQKDDEGLHDVEKEAEEVSEVKADEVEKGNVEVKEDEVEPLGDNDPSYCPLQMFERPGLHTKLVRAHEMGKYAVHLCCDMGAKHRAQLCEFWGDVVSSERIYKNIVENLCAAIKELAKGYTEVNKIPASVVQGLRSVARNSRGGA